MESLAKIYTELTNPNNIKHCYYYDNIDMDYSTSSAYDFIRGYLRCGRKSNLIEDINESKFLKMRAEHMRSTFLLGICIYDTIVPVKEAINNIIIKLHEKAKQFNNEAKQSEIIEKYNNNYHLNYSEQRCDLFGI